jgi:hypothetical protein
VLFNFALFSPALFSCFLYTYDVINIYLDGGDCVADKHYDYGRDDEHERQNGHSLGLPRIGLLQDLVDARSGTSAHTLLHHSGHYNNIAIRQGKGTPLLLPNALFWQPQSQNISNWYHFIAPAHTK